MASNDQIILEQIIEEQRTKRFPSVSKSSFFELYVAEQILKDYDLSDDELESGLMGSGGDGGIDGIYTLVNGDIALEDYDSDSLKKDVVLEVIIIQAKTSASFGEDAMNKFAATARNLFDLSKPLNSFKGVYNESLLSSVDIFRSLYKKIASRFPRLQFNYFYVTLGDSLHVHPNVSRKQDDVKSAIAGHFSAAKFNFSFYGASNLLLLARRQPVTAYDLETKECLSPKDGYIALVELQKFYGFLHDEDTGQIRKNLFEANVRDYQGSNQVNEEIQHSLVEKGKEEFWWLNNGITIVSTKATQSSKVLTIEDPQIVNGQQTSTEIFKYFQSEALGSESRSVMVRIIVTTDPAIRDKVIKATNSQTTIMPASLRATDKIHRDIEEYLSPFGIYYDRRKNSQKNLGRPIDKIVSISLLAQSVMAIVLQRPDSARARPSTLLKKNEDYQLLFSSDYPIELYLVVAKVIKGVQAFLRSLTELQQKDKTNLTFYVAMYFSAFLTNKPTPGVKDILGIDYDSLPADGLALSLSVVKKLYEDLGATDQVAKGAQLLVAVKKYLADSFASH